MGDNVLITGGAGFIGSNMADRLLGMGNSVTIIDNLSTGSEDNVPKGARFVKGSVANIGDVQKAFDPRPDIVFHIAGQASTIKSFDKPLDDVNTNLVGTINVLTECIRHETPRFLYASSMTSYGHPKELPVKETAPCMPISYYGITKYSAGRYVHATAERNDLSFEFNPTSFRMFNVYGPRQSLDNPYQGVMAIFISKVMRKEPITLFGDGEQSRDFVYIDDVVDAWVGSVNEKKSFNEVFNLGTGTRISMNMLIDGILKAFGTDQDSYQINREEARPGDQRHMQADISKAKRVLGWKPKVSLDEGLRRTIEWALQQSK
jgi:UDP-glucose 4-epimerase